MNENEQVSDVDVVELDFSDTRALSDPSIFKEKQAKQGRGDKKKTRKERAAERVKEREAIEDGWDDPTKGQVTLTPSVSNTSTAQAHSSPVKYSAPSATTNEKSQEKMSYFNGNGHSLPHKSASDANGVSADVAREALLVSLVTHDQGPARDLPRKQFVQEVLSLIYVSVVDHFSQCFFCSIAADGQ